MWCWQELNRRHMDFQSIALPPELQHLLCGPEGDCPNGNAKVVIIFNLAKVSRKNFKNSLLQGGLELRKGSGKQGARAGYVESHIAFAARAEHCSVVEG